MDHVLLLNNECYVDSIKDTWAEKAGYHSGPGPVQPEQLQIIPFAHFGAVKKYPTCRYFAAGDPTEDIYL